MFNLCIDIVNTLFTFEYDFKTKLIFKRMNTNENTMPKGKDLKTFLCKGDIKKIVDISEVSHSVVTKWLTDEDYRNSCDVKIDTLITNAYSKIIIANAKERQKNLNRISQLENEFSLANNG